MYASLKGILTEKHPAGIVIDCHGVGYELSIPLSTYQYLPAKGEQVLLQVHYQFNETDGARLYGFFSREEKELFRLLLGVSKIGPRTAIAVLSTLSAEEFQRAVLEINLNLIASVPGIGKKSAERLVLELKDKIKASSGSESRLLNSNQSATEDALAALMTLGFSDRDVSKCFNKLNRNKSYESAEDLIKDTIKELHKK